MEPVTAIMTLKLALGFVFVVVAAGGVVSALRFIVAYLRPDNEPEAAPRVIRPAMPPSRVRNIR